MGRPKQPKNAQADRVQKPRVFPRITEYEYFERTEDELCPQILTHLTTFSTVLNTMVGLSQRVQGPDLVSSAGDTGRRSRSDFWKMCQGKIERIRSSYAKINDYRSVLKSLSLEELAASPSLPQLFEEYKIVLGSLVRLRREWLAHNQGSTDRLFEAGEEWGFLTLTVPGAVWDPESFQHSDYHLLTELRRMLELILALPVAKEYLPRTRVPNEEETEVAADGGESLRVFGSQGKKSDLSISSYSAFPPTAGTSSFLSSYSSIDESEDEAPALRTRKSWKQYSRRVRSVRAAKVKPLDDDALLDYMKPKATCPSRHCHCIHCYPLNLPESASCTDDESDIDTFAATLDIRPEPEMGISRRRIAEALRSGTPLTKAQESQRLEDIEHMKFKKFVNDFERKMAEARELSFELWLWDGLGSILQNVYEKSVVPLWAGCGRAVMTVRERAPYYWKMARNKYSAKVSPLMSPENEEDDFVIIDMPGNDQSAPESECHVKSTTIGGRMGMVNLRPDMNYM